MIMTLVGSVKPKCAIWCGVMHRFDFVVYVLYIQNANKKKNETLMCIYTRNVKCMYVQYILRFVDDESREWV